METAMTSAAAKAARASSVSVQQMPLSFLKEGESAHVVKGAQVAIGRQAASHIITSAATA